MTAAPESLPAWDRLARLAQRMTAPDASASAPGQPPPVRVGPLLVDLSRQRFNADVLAALADLARESGLADAVRDQLDGADINVTEGRPALHSALRAAPEHVPATVAGEIVRGRRRMLDFADAVRGGERRGFTAKPIRTVVHIGIGGSHLGPQTVCDALTHLARGAPQVRFLANVDGHATEAALAGLDPATTLFVVVSKSFSTEETLANANAARAWFLERTCDDGAIADHFVAVTANTGAAARFGISAGGLFPMWDWVGGRYSAWSAVGLPIAIRLGSAGFAQFLDGARLVDEHLRAAPVERNAAVLLALAGIWNTNFLGAGTHAVLVYDHRLRRLADHLQQLEMESNGKAVRRDGQPSAVHTSAVVWGGEETNGQHSFHQLLHQGTRTVSADLVAVVNPDHRLADHHRRLLANCLAQGQALQQGDPSDDPHRRVPGRRPSSTILLDELTPRSIGALLALYEQKVFCAGAVLKINSFDQWGVELGKKLAPPILSTLSSGTPAAGVDAAAAALADIIRTRKR